MTAWKELPLVLHIIHVSASLMTPKGDRSVWPTFSEFSVHPHTNLPLHANLISQFVSWFVLAIFSSFDHLGVSVSVQAVHLRLSCSLSFPLVCCIVFDCDSIVCTLSSKNERFYTDEVKCKVQQSHGVFQSFLLSSCHVFILFMYKGTVYINIHL